MLDWANFVKYNPKKKKKKIVAEVQKYIQISWEYKFYAKCTHKTYKTAYVAHFSQKKIIYTVHVLIHCT